MIEETVKRIIKRIYPELTGSLHLPHWGRVVAVYPIKNQAKSSAANPHYCADVQLLDADGQDDTAVEVFQSLPLPITAAGESRGVYGFPQPGARVELAFIHGRPDKPFIRCILAESLTMPALESQDILIQKDVNNHYRIDSQNNITEQCQAIAERIADLKQRVVVKNGTVWVGNQETNVLRVLADLLGVVSDLATTAATHTHPCSPSKTGPPDTDPAADFAKQSEKASELAGELNPIVDG